MCFPCDIMDVKVIYKDLKKLLQPFKENVGHCLGKDVGCIIQPKWHHKPFIRAFLGDECYFLHIFRIHLIAKNHFAKPKM